MVRRPIIQHTLLGLKDEQAQNTAEKAKAAVRETLVVMVVVVQVRPSQSNSSWLYRCVYACIYIYI